MLARILDAVEIEPGFVVRHSPIRESRSFEPRDGDDAARRVGVGEAIEQLFGDASGRSRKTALELATRRGFDEAGRHEDGLERDLLVESLAHEMRAFEERMIAALPPETPDRLQRLVVWA